MSQVHKEQLSAVDNALPNRSSLDIEIFGMEGVPEDIVQAHNQRVMTQFQQAEMERRAATGNPPPGVSSDNGPAKKPKLEISDLKKRLAEHKAKLAEKASGGSSGDVTPVGAGQTSQAGNGTVKSSRLISMSLLHPKLISNRAANSATLRVRSSFSTTVISSTLREHQLPISASRKSWIARCVTKRSTSV